MKYSSSKKIISVLLTVVIMFSACFATSLFAAAEGEVCVEHGSSTYEKATVVITATCTVGEMSELWSYCSFCNEKVNFIRYIVGEALGHKDLDDNGYCDTCKENICKHSETEIINANAVTCESDGYTGNLSCVKCGLILDKGNIIHSDGHDFDDTLPVDVIPPTCSSERVLVYKCRKCSATRKETDKGSGTLSHNIIVYERVEPTCKQAGYVVEYCVLCYSSPVVKPIEPLGHFDENGDGKCDRSGCGVVIPALGEPEPCLCMCHAESGIKQFIFNLLNMIYKLLNIKAECVCGAMHY